MEGWVNDYGVQFIGGCCGLGPEYITAVSAFLRKHNAVMRDQRSQGRRGQIWNKIKVQHELSRA